MRIRFLNGYSILSLTKICDDRENDDLKTVVSINSSICLIFFEIK